MEKSQACLKTTLHAVSDYAVCPAKCFINTVTDQKPAKEIVLERLRKGLNDLTLSSLEREGFTGEAIDRIASLIVRGLEYEDKDKDHASIAGMYETLSNLLKEYEYTIISSYIPFELAYNDGKVLVSSAIDLTVRDGRRGYTFPAIVDFSKTKYEPWYNPVVYRAQAVVDYLDLTGTNTEVIVLGAGYGKRWIYEKKKFGALIHSAIDEMAGQIREGVFPVRFGWWCKICTYRTICTGILEKEKKRYGYL